MKAGKSVILVTGTHRSGSSWVGKMLSRSKEVIYHSEPFNPAFRPYGPIRQWFQYFSPDIADHHTILSFLESQYKFNPFRSIRYALGALSTRTIKVYVKDTLCHVRHLLAPGKTALFKDPIALLSAPMIAHKLNAQVVVVIRNPWAFIASLKVANWNFPFSHFVEQEALIYGELSAFRTEILAATKEERPGGHFLQGSDGNEKHQFQNIRRRYRKDQRHTGITKQSF